LDAAAAIINLIGAMLGLLTVRLWLGLSRSVLEYGTTMSDLTCFACDKNTPHVLPFKVNGCEIWQCERCGLGRAETSTFDPKSYYTVDYFSGRCGDGYSDYRGAEPVLRREFARSIDFVRRFIPSGRLLDLGCAYGFFLKEARCHFEVFGIELAEHAAASCREAGLNVLSGVANESNMERIGEVDVITMFDVIEHLPEPREVLALCYRYLKPGGIIVITTGDFASMAARWAGAKWRLMTPPQHLWYFTKESLRKMSGQVGLSMEHFDHPVKRVPLSLIVFQLQRMLGLRGSPITVASRIGIPVNLFDAMRVVLRKGAS
jgi:SAM-dependent methyltransferase